MAKSQETYSKKEKEKKRLKKRQEKALKREERKANSEGGSLDAMMAYVDEHGRIVDEPIDPTKKKAKIDVNSINLGAARRDDVEETPNEGRLAFFNTDKGYGFIKDLHADEKYFVHINNMLEEIKENDKVTFELERGPRGMSAVQVQKLKKVAPKPAPKPEEGEEKSGDEEE